LWTPSSRSKCGGVPEGGLPDPNDPMTFEHAKLPWGEFVHEERRAALDRFRTRARWRRELVWPLATTPYLNANVLGRAIA
jgi:maltooligosyltrehalose trehalohydrolase